MNYDECTRVLEDIINAFNLRVEKLNEALNKLNTRQPKEDDVKDMVLRYNLNRLIEKYRKNITKQTAKIQKKQDKLFKKNKVDLLEKNIYNAIQLLNNGDEQLIESINCLVDEAINDIYLDKVNFAKDYVSLMIEATLGQIDIYKKQIDFIKAHQQ